MVSSLFSDKVVFRFGINPVREIECKYLGVLDGKIYIRTSNDKLERINCSDVITVINDDKKLIKFDCSDNTFTPRALTELDIKEIKRKVSIGGIFITIGALILVVSLESEVCTDCSVELMQRDTDDIKNIQRLGYLTIAFGGILMTNGI